jgi:hypothetical protein
MLPRVWCHYCDSYRLFASEVGREAKATPIFATIPLGEMVSGPRQLSHMFAAGRVLPPQSK